MADHHPGGSPSSEGVPSGVFDAAADSSAQRGFARALDRRRFLQFAGMSVGAAMLAACTKSSGNNGNPSSSATPTATGPFRSVAFPGAPAQPADPMALSTGGTVPAPPGYSLPLESATFTIAMTDNIYAARSYTQGLPVWKEFERRTGVKVKWEVTPAQQYAAAMSPRLGSGNDLPDFMAVPNGWDPVKAASQKLAIPLDDYINEENTPNIVAYFKQFPEIRKLLTAPDGKLYALTSVVADAAKADPVGLLIRQDWLSKVNVAQPTTLDEWYSVLKAFKTGNPSGSGKGNEIPFISGGFGVQSLRPFGNALGLHLLYSSGWYVDDSGKVLYEYLDPRYRELLTWVNKLYKEHLIDPDYYKNDPTASLQKVTNNLAGATASFSNGAIAYNDAQAKAGQPAANWIMTPPPTSKDVTTPYYEAYGPTSGYYIVTKSCKNPKQLMHWLDYVWASDEGNTLVTYGIEGQTYTVGADKRLQLTDWVTKNPQGLDPNSALRYYGAEPTMPWIRATQGPLSEFSWDMTRSNPKWLAISSAIAKYVVPSYPKILPSEQETAELGKVATDIGTFLAENEVKFVLGQEPLTDSGWNKYVSTLKGLGVDTVVKVHQQQWDRYSKH